MFTVSCDQIKRIETLILVKLSRLRFAVLTNSVILHFSAIEFGHVYRSDSVIYFGHLSKPLASCKTVKFSETNLAAKFQLKKTRGKSFEPNVLNQKNCVKTFWWVDK